MDQGPVEADDLADRRTHDRRDQAHNDRHNVPRSRNRNTEVADLDLSGTEMLVIDGL